MKEDTYIPTYNEDDFNSAVADGEHANAAIIAATIAEDPSLSDVARQGWVDAAWKQYWMISEDDGCTRADVLEFLQPNGTFDLSTLPAPSSAHGFMIMEGTDMESVEKAISMARCTGSNSATFRDGANYAEVTRLPFTTENKVGPVEASEAAEITGDGLFEDIDEDSRFFICKDTLWWFEQRPDGKFYTMIMRDDWVVDTQEEIIKIMQDNYFI